MISRPRNNDRLLPASLGFRSGSMSVHTSRTMMLDDLTVLLDRVPFQAIKDGYLSAVLEENVLGKPTRSTRERSAKRLSELYALDASCPLFRLLRHYWTVDRAGRPMLAFLAAAARDPLLRQTTPFVLGVPIGESLRAEQIGNHLEEIYPGRFQATTRHSTAQNLASSWTQAGYLQGKVRKVRTRPRITPVVLAYAITLGHLCGLRGKMLLQSPWVQLLDREPDDLNHLAFEASAQGWINYKTAGGVIEITLHTIPATKAEGHE
jgi:hypothetical protein